MFTKPKLPVFSHDLCLCQKYDKFLSLVIQGMESFSSDRKKMQSFVLKENKIVSITSHIILSEWLLKILSYSMCILFGKLHLLEHYSTFEKYFI